MLTWVVGAGGMLGRALVARATDHGATVFDATAVPWSDPTAAQRVIRADVERFATTTGPWTVLWAAGSSVVASRPTQTGSELAALTTLVEALAHHAPRGPGAVFVTSSAGGVYAGSAGAPFTAATHAVPISPYGDLKLRQEQVARTALDGRIPLVIGRFSNLYGPGHNTGKGQGLIPLLCRATVRRTPLNLYVSMDTVRDYLFVDDAAALAWRATIDAVGTSPPRTQVEVIASGRPATIAEVIATVQAVAHRRVPLALGTDASARHQVTDLRLVPSVDVGSVPLTPMPSGVRRVLDAVAGQPA